MPDMKLQIVGWVGQIDDLKKQIADHWLMVQQSVSAGDTDKAITLLNAYFRLKTKLEGVEASLAGTLGGYFSDK
jgi:hypothetical protein